MSDKFKAARDFLLANRTAYDVAYRGFRWPKLELFNWALDWFDAIAAGERGDQLALWVVFEDGRETKFTFRELSVFVPNQSRFNAKGLLEAITRANVTTFCAPPTVRRILVTQQLTDYKTNLREAVSAGEPLNPEVIDQDLDP